MSESEKKLDMIISSLSRIEEKLENHKEDIVKLEKSVDGLNTDMNKGKGAIAFLGVLGVIMAFKTYLISKG